MKYTSNSETPLHGTNYNTSVLSHSCQHGNCSLFLNGVWEPSSGKQHEAFPLPSCCNIVRWLNRDIQDNKLLLNFLDATLHDNRSHLVLQSTATYGTEQKWAFSSPWSISTATSLCCSWSHKIHFTGIHTLTRKYYVKDVREDLKFHMIYTGKLPVTWSVQHNSVYEQNISLLTIKFKKENITL